MLRRFGTFTAPAANEVGRNVEATVFHHPLVPVGEPLSEIEELQWTDPAAQLNELAPLLKDVVFPALFAGPRKIQSLAVFTGSVYRAPYLFMSRRQKTSHVLLRIRGEPSFMAVDAWA